MAQIQQSQVRALITEFDEGPCFKHASVQRKRQLDVLQLERSFMESLPSVQTRVLSFLVKFKQANDSWSAQFVLRNVH